MQNQELKQENIYEEINNKLLYINNNDKIKNVDLPDNINKEENYIDINFKIKKGVNYNLITFVFDCYKDKTNCIYLDRNYIDRYKDKSLVFPANIKYLIIKNCEFLDCNLDFSKATDLEYLHLQSVFYQEYDNFRLLHNYNHSFYHKKINNWPPNLKYLVLDEYNYPLHNLPSTLQYINIPYNFNHSLDNLPIDLIGISFSNCGNNNYNFNNKKQSPYELNSLPSKLKFLKMENYLQYNYSIKTLPLSIENLDLGDGEYYSLNNLPDSITYLTFGSVIEPITKLPHNLKELKIYYNPIYKKQILEYLNDSEFPNSFETLKIIDNDKDLFMTKSQKNNLQTILKKKFSNSKKNTIMFISS